MFKNLAPGFLLATPTLTDPNFRQTVVLLFAHSPDGAMGLVVNRPTRRPLEEVLRGAGLPCPDDAVGQRRVFTGGPVATDAGWVVFRGEDPRGESFGVVDDVRVTGSLEVFRAQLEDPARGEFLFLLGYAGWSAGQLEEEIEVGAWLPAPADARTLFDEPEDQRWRQAFLNLGIDPSLWSLSTGDG